MNTSKACPQKITILKQKIIEVGKLLSQCNEHKTKNVELLNKEKKYLKYLRALSSQYVKVLSEKQRLETELEALRRSYADKQSVLAETQLDVVRLQQLVEIYKTEREEYGIEKVEKLQQKLQKVLSLFMEQTKNRTGTFRIPIWFYSTFSSELKQHREVCDKSFELHREPPVPSPAPSITSSVTASDSGIESMIGSPLNHEDSLSGFRGQGKFDECLTKSNNLEFAPFATLPNETEVMRPLGESSTGTVACLDHSDKNVINNEMNMPSSVNLFNEVEHDPNDSLESKNCVKSPDDGFYCQQEQKVSVSIVSPGPLNNQTLVTSSGVETDLLPPLTSFVEEELSISVRHSEASAVLSVQPAVTEMHGEQNSSKWLFTTAAGLESNLLETTLHAKHATGNISESSSDSFSENNSDFPGEEIFPSPQSSEYSTGVKEACYHSKKAKESRNAVDDLQEKYNGSQDPYKGREILSEVLQKGQKVAVTDPQVRDSGVKASVNECIQAENNLDCVDSHSKQTTPATLKPLVNADECDKLKNHECPELKDSAGCDMEVLPLLDEVCDVPAKSFNESSPSKIPSLFSPNGKTGKVKLIQKNSKMVMTNDEEKLNDINSSPGNKFFSPAKWLGRDVDSIPDSVTMQIFKVFKPAQIALSPIQRYDAHSHLDHPSNNTQENLKSSVITNEHVLEFGESTKKTSYKEQAHDVKELAGVNNEVGPTTNHSCNIGKADGRKMQSIEKTRNVTKDQLGTSNKKVSTKEQLPDQSLEKRDVSYLTEDKRGPKPTEPIGNSKLDCTLIKNKCSSINSLEVATQTNCEASHLFIESEPNGSINTSYTKDVDKADPLKVWNMFQIFCKMLKVKKRTRRVPRRALWQVEDLKPSRAKVLKAKKRILHKNSKHERNNEMTISALEQQRSDVLLTESDSQQEGSRKFPVPFESEKSGTSSPFLTHSSSYFIESNSKVTPPDKKVEMSIDAPAQPKTQQHTNLCSFSDDQSVFFCSKMEKNEEGVKPRSSNGYVQVSMSESLVDPNQKANKPRSTLKPLVNSHADILLETSSASKKSGIGFNAVTSPLSDVMNIVPKPSKISSDYVIVPQHSVSTFLITQTSQRVKSDSTSHFLSSKANIPVDTYMTCVKEVPNQLLRNDSVILNTGNRLHSSSANENFPSEDYPIEESPLCSDELLTPPRRSLRKRKFSPVCSGGKSSETPNQGIPTYKKQQTQEIFGEDLDEDSPVGSCFMVRSANSDRTCVKATPNQPHVRSDSVQLNSENPLHSPSDIEHFPGEDSPSEEIPLLNYESPTPPRRSLRKRKFSPVCSGRKSSEIINQVVPAHKKQRIEDIFGEDSHESNGFVIKPENWSVRREDDASLITPVSKTSSYLSNEMTKEGNEQRVDIKSTKSFSTSTISMVNHRPNIDFNPEEVWEKSRLMKTKNCVLASQGLAPVSISADVRPMLQTVTYSPPLPELVKPLPQDFSPAISTRGSAKKLKESDGKDLLSDIISIMERPPDVAKPVRAVIQGETKKKKKKKNRGKKRKRAREHDKVETPLDLPRPTFSVPGEEVASTALEQFLTANNATAKDAAAQTKHCLDSLKTVPNSVLIRTIVNVVIENVNEDLDMKFTPPAPPLTPTQHRLFALFGSDSRFPPLYADMLAAVRSVFLPETFVWPDDSLRSCAQFCAALCRQMNDMQMAVQLCVDAAVGMPQRGSLVISAVLAAWPEVLPFADKANPYGPGATLAMVVLQTPLPSRKVQENSLRVLKQLLQGYYGYSPDVKRNIWGRQALEALRSGDASAGRALTMVGTSVGWEWSEKNVVAPLMENLGVWQYGGVQDTTAVKLLSVIARTVAAYPSKAKPKEAKRAVVERLGEILLSGKVSEEGEEAIVDVIVRLHSILTPFSSVLQRWVPRRAVSDRLWSQLQDVLSNPKKKKKRKA